MPRSDNFDLAQRVFIEFARFEYCLKRLGYLKKDNGPAEPDWDKFANTNEMKNLFLLIKENESENFKKLRYLFDNPPKHQIARNGCLDWKPAEKIRSSQDYFSAVRRVRNNLFHGGKFNGNFFEPERSTDLLESVLFALKEARECHAGVAEAYDNAT